MTKEARILLIDDHAPDRALAGALLRDALPKAEIVEVTGAIDFAVNFRARGWTVAIAEHALGWANGTEALRLLKHRNPRCTSILFSKQTPHIIGSVHSDLTDRAGPDVYIKKVTAGYLQLVETVQHAIAATQPPAAVKALTSRANKLHEEIAEFLDSSGQDIPRSELDTLRGSATALSAMFDQRAKAGDDPGSYSDIDLKRAIRSAMWTLAKELRRCGMRVRSGRLPTVRADAAALHNFFRCLLAFAVKRADNNRVCATVRTRTRPNDWLLSFHIEGIKPSKSDLENLFVGEADDPNAGELAECARIAEQHDGNMWLEVGTDGSLNFLASLRVEVVDPIRVEVQYNGRPVGQVNVIDDQSRHEITRAALTLPALSQDLTESTIKLVEFVDKGVVNIVA